MNLTRSGKFSVSFFIGTDYIVLLAGGQIKTFGEKKNNNQKTKPANQIETSHSVYNIVRCDHLTNGFSIFPLLIIVNYRVSPRDVYVSICGVRSGKPKR